MTDVIMTDAPSKPDTKVDISSLLQTPHCDAFAFSNQEKHILTLYDQLTELELEQALYEESVSQTHHVSNLSDDQVQQALAKAQNEAAEARAEYLLRRNITTSVLVTDPILKAVHGGALTGRILPLITERDVVSMVDGKLSSNLKSLLDKLTSAEKNSMLALEKNKQLAQILLPLAEELKSQSINEIEDPQLRREVEAAEKEANHARQTVNLLKGVIAGMIVGSGVNWAEDEELRDLVMDDEDEG